MDLSIVIPVYRSAGTLESLIEQLLPALDRLQRTYEIVLVDDGSPDNSWATLLELQRRYPEQIVAIQLMRNYGQHNALMCGFRHARGEFIVTMDDDLQNPPEEIEKLLTEIEERDLDLVYGQYDHKRHASWRNLGSWLVNTFYRSVFHTDVTVTSFRVIRRSLLDSILSHRRTFTFLDGLLAWNTQRIGATLVNHESRREGRSGYSIAKLIALGLNLITNFSLLPLQFVSLLGIVTALGGFGLGATYLTQALFSDVVVPGYASTIVAVLVLGGMQLLALGVMGEYLGRMHLNVNGKPQYHERQVLNQVAAAEALNDDPHDLVTRPVEFPAETPKLTRRAG